MISIWFLVLCLCLLRSTEWFRWCFSAFTLWRVEYPDALIGGAVPWDQTRNGMRVSAAVRLRSVVSGAYLTLQDVSLVPLLPQCALVLDPSDKFYYFCGTSVCEKAWRSRKRVAQAT